MRVYRSIHGFSTQQGPDGAWQQFERGEIDLWTFYSAFGQQLSNAERGNMWYANYCKRNGTSKL